MTGLLHAMVEDAAREAGCTVAQMLAPQMGKGPAGFDAAKRAAIMRAVEAGYSREQIARAFKRSKRSIVRIVTRARNGRPRYPTNPQADHGRAQSANSV